jgi:hypothetical protein
LRQLRNIEIPGVLACAGRTSGDERCPTQSVMAGQKRVEDARERAYARPSTSFRIKTWMPATRAGMTSR